MVVIALILLLGVMMANIEFRDQLDDGSGEGYESDPLRFSIWSYSETPHKVEVNILAENNNSIFNETYMINASGGMYSPVIVQSPAVTSTLGSYKYVVTMDDNITRVQSAQVRYAQTLSSSDHVSIEIFDDEDEPLRFAISIA